MHVSDNLVAIEKKEKAEAQARARAKAQAQAEAQAQAKAQAEAQSQSQNQSRSQTQSQTLPPKPKPGQLNLPFNAFQAQLQKSVPGGVRPASSNAAQRPGGPNRTMSFPAFPAGFSKPVTPVNPGSGLSSLAASAYNSPLPSPGLTGPSKSPWFPFSPKIDGGDSNNTVSLPRSFLPLGFQLTR